MIDDITLFAQNPEPEDETNLMDENFLDLKLCCWPCCRGFVLSKLFVLCPRAFPIYVGWIWTTKFSFPHPLIWNPWTPGTYFLLLFLEVIIMIISLDYFHSVKTSVFHVPDLKQCCLKFNFSPIRNSYHQQKFDKS